MSAFSILDLNFVLLRAGLFEPSEHDSAIPFWFHENNVSLVNPGLFPGFHWDDHLASIVNGCSHWESLMQALLPVNAFRT